jgi:hypothetical protein
VQADQEAKEGRSFVVKDDSQTRCAMCNEPFMEEWNDSLQEWVYLDAVRLPPAIAELPGINLPSGCIVKVGLLDPGTLKLLQEYSEEEQGSRGGVKRKGKWVDTAEEGRPNVRQAVAVKGEDNKLLIHLGAA